MHSINLILIRKSELRTAKISSIINSENIDYPNLSSPYLCLPQSIMAFPELTNQSVFKYFGEGILFLKVITDYFGGPGEQSAFLYETTKNGSKLIKEFIDINSALREYGVKRSSERKDDEFDAINLGQNRTNDDYLEEIKKLQLINQIIKTTPSF